MDHFVRVLDPRIKYCYSESQSEEDFLEKPLVPQSQPSGHAPSQTEQLAHWMIENSFATGHGDSFADLLKELTWQVAELRKKLAPTTGALRIKE
jgi:hypothetical protein